jgi:hypothetical protein
MFVSDAPARCVARRFTSVATARSDTCVEHDTHLAATDNARIARVSAHNFFFTLAQHILVCQRFAKDG